MKNSEENITKREVYINSSFVYSLRLTKLFKSSVLLLMLLTILTGIIYPLLITAVGQILFPYQSQGSLIFKDKILVGSELLGQSFQNPKYFWGRASSTFPYPYNALKSGGSNLGPTNPALVAAMKLRIKNLKEHDPTNTSPIPLDLVTSSGSGLDPHISPKAAFYQVQRVANIRHLSVEQVKKLIATSIEHRQWGILGEERVNVLKLNLLLDNMTANHDE